GHRAEVAQRLVGVLADLEVDLRERVKPSYAVGIQEQGDVDAVSGDKRELLEQLAPSGDLAGEWLLDRGELGIEHAQQRPSRELCDAAPAVGQDGPAQAERPPVEALDERDPALTEQWPEQSAGEVRPELLGVGIKEAHHL